MIRDEGQELMKDKRIWGVDPGKLSMRETDLQQTNSKCSFVNSKTFIRLERSAFL